MRRTLRGRRMGMAVVAALAGSAGTASAQVVQSLNLSGGIFIPRGQNSRKPHDVWIADVPIFLFETNDFTSGEISGEWNIAFNNRLELGIGAAYYQDTIHTLYRDYVDIDFSEIRSDFTLRASPFTGVIRFMPFGKPGSFQPYIGGGVAVTPWKYSEIGKFIDFNDNNTVYNGRYIANGTSVGPVALAGFRLPINGDVYALTVEGRYMWAEGALNPNDFLDTKIDLGATSVRFGFLIRF